MMKRGDISHQDSNKILPGRVLLFVARETDRNVSHNAEISPQVVRRLLPQVRAPPFYLPDLLERILKVLDVMRRELSA